MTRKLCIDCDTRPADRSTPNSQLCIPCDDYAGWENEHSDNGHEDPEGSDSLDLANVMSACPVCNPELDPRNDAPTRKGHTNTVAKTYTSHATCAHVRTPKAREMCRRARAATLDNAIAAVIADPITAGARSRAKTNEYRAASMTVSPSLGSARKLEKLPRCTKCGSYRYDDKVTAPDVDAMCGPTYCHYALEN